jgi:hypothetical protein
MEEVVKGVEAFKVVLDQMGKVASFEVKFEETKTL